MTPSDPLRPELEAALDAALRGEDHPDPRAAAARRALELVDALPRAEPPPELRRRLLRRLDAVDAARERRLLPRLWRALTGPVGGGLTLAGAAAGIALVLDAGSPGGVPEPLARMERLETAEELELYENLEIVENLDVLDDLELIEALPEEEAG